MNTKIRPNDAIPIFESAVKDALKHLLSTTGAATLDMAGIPDFQIIFESSQRSYSLRKLTAEHVNTLVKVGSYVYYLIQIANV